jgi:hypothetical protein
MRVSSLVKAGCAVVVAVVLVPAAAPAVTFNFEDIPPFTPTPIMETVGGLTATFTGKASVCDTGGVFVGLTGNVLIQDFCNDPAAGDQTGPLTISLPVGLDNSVSLDFATVPGAGTLTVEAFEGGNLVSTSIFDTTIPPMRSFGEGVALVSGPFDMLVLTGSGNTLLAIDNVSTPEPASIALLGTGLAGLVLARRRRKAGQAPV